MRSLRLFLFLLTASVSAAATFTWNGAAGDHQYNNPANWVGGVVPPNNGTATLVFGNAPDSTVVLPFVLDVAQIQFQNTAATAYTFNSRFITFLTVANGITSSSGGTERIDANITLNLSGTQNFNVSSGSLEIAGGLIGFGSLVKTGAGSLRIGGFNLLTGNTQVDTGALIFANDAAVPAFGSVTSNHNGYVGAENSDTLNALIGQIDNASFLGSVGLDTAPSHDSPAVFTDPVNVANLTNYAGLGSSTSARLTGAIRLASGHDYRFGGGTGTLYVESNLSSATAGLQIKSTFGQPLTVVLRGNNSFTGNSSVSNSVLVLDSAHASPGRILTIEGPGYIGATENFATSTAGFLSLLRATSANSIVGFDSANIAAPRTITQAIDLSLGGTRSNAYYLGTSSKVTLTGALTPTVGSPLYLTAVKGGYLTVGSTLGDAIPGLVVGQTTSFDPQGGTVELTGRNTYTGGTKLLSNTLRVSNNAALGTGSVAVSDRATLDISSGITFSNSFSLASGARLAGTGSIGTAGGAIFGPGAILSPGGAQRIGSLTFNTGLTLGSGSVIEFDLGNLNGAPGTGWDLINVYEGQLKLTAISASPITINLTSLTPNGVDGLLYGFGPNQSYSWLFASGNVTGFSSSNQFAFSTANFANNLGSGNFFVSQGNAGLSIQFTPVPEPSTYVLFAIGLAVVAILEFRRRK